MCSQARNRAQILGSSANTKAANVKAANAKAVNAKAVNVKAVNVKAVNAKAASPTSVSIPGINPLSAIGLGHANLGEAAQGCVDLVGSRFAELESL